MFNHKSDYAINKKDSDAIVYLAADGSTTRVTRSEFSSEDEFLFWKALSDADYHALEKSDHVHANHTISLEELSDEAAVVPGADFQMQAELDRHSQHQMNLELVLKSRLVCLQLSSADYGRIVLRKRLWKQSHTTRG